MTFKKGYIPPSGLLDVIPKEKISAFNKNYSNTPVRMGVINKVHEIDDKSNVSKLFPEYDIVTSEQNGLMGQSFVEYTNCISMDSLGGIGDFFEVKKRAYEKENFRDSYEFKKQDGTMVLMLCVDGFTDKGIIIGGVPHSARETNLKKEAGLHLEGEYNGLNWKVNKDGELTVTFRSKTDNKGIAQDEKAGGTHLKIDKTGSVDINTNLKEKEETYIKMDKTNKDLSLKSGNKTQILAISDISFATDANIKGAAKASVEFLSEGTAKVSAKSSLDLEGKSAVTVKGGNVTINGQNGVTIEGQKTSINSPKVYLGTGGSPAIIATTKFVGKDGQGAPVVCTAAGPFSKSVFIA